MILPSLAIVLAAGCRDEAPRGGRDPDTASPERPYRTVVLLTIDTLNERFLGYNGAEWGATPNIDALLAQSAVLEDTITVKGATGVALPSLLTGVYPRSHGLRGGLDIAPPPQPMLQERFQKAGYTTLAWSNNHCYPLFDEGLDEQVCTWNEDKLGTQHERDALLAASLIDRVAELGEDEPAFLWLHLFDPHFVYEPQEPWFSAFHPDPYEGGLDLTSDASAVAAMFGEAPFTAQDRRYLEAVYASQVAAADALVGEVLAGLEASGRFGDDTLLVFGADHGEELALHNNFFWHACSPYDPVLDLTYAVRAPRHLAPGALRGPVSITDVAPTMIALAGLEWIGQADGLDLTAALASGEAPDRPVYFEVGVRRAGIVDQRYKYLLNPTGPADDCLPYSQHEGRFFPLKEEELYDRAADPDEQADLAPSDPAAAAAMRAALCGWIREDTWVSAGEDADNPLVQACAP